MTKTHNGFTLIELMIVIGIVAILAAFALPAYKNYTERTYVSESLTLIGDAKTRVIDYYVNTQRIPIDNGEVGLPAPNQITGQAVTKVEVGDGTANPSHPIIVITYNQKVTNGATLAFVMDTTKGAGSYQWICGKADPTGTNVGTVAADNTNTLLRDEWLPVNCR